MSHQPASPPTSQTYHGQHYELVRRDPYTRRDGTLSTLAVWRSHCAQCGEPFELRTPANSSKFVPNRRCQAHKRPGVRAKPKVKPLSPPDEHWPDIHDHMSQLEDAGILPDLEDYA
jgi:hypothetical protein